MLLTSEAQDVVATPDSEDWVPPWWGTDEENMKEAEEFSKWTRSVAKT